MQILFTDRVLPTTRCRDKILGGGGELSPYRPKVMAACTFILSSTFLLHRLVLYCFSAFWEGVHTSHGWGDMEFASRSSADWRGSHPWAITCSISVQSFCMQRYSSVAKMHMAPEKFNNYEKFNKTASLYAKVFCNEHDPWHSLQDSKPWSHMGLLCVSFFTQSARQQALITHGFAFVSFFTQSPRQQALITHGFAFVSFFTQSARQQALITHGFAFVSFFTQSARQQALITHGFAFVSFFTQSARQQALITHGFAFVSFFTESAQILILKK